MAATLFKIESKNKQLFIIYDKQRQGLYNYFSSDTRMFEYIQQNPENAFKDAVTEDSLDKYILNIASTQNLGFFEWKDESELLSRQLNAFTPIIQLFILKCITEYPSSKVGMNLLGTIKHPSGKKGL